MKLPVAFVALLAFAALIIFLSLPTPPIGFEKCMKWKEPGRLYVICKAQEFSFTVPEDKELLNFLSGVFGDERPTAIEFFMENNRWKCNVKMPSGGVFTAPEAICAAIAYETPAKVYVAANLIKEVIPGPVRENL